MRRRILSTLMATAALGGLGQLIGLTVGGLLVQDILHGKKWVGTANAASSIGTAIGALTLAKYMQRSGRRRGLSLGYVIGAVGALLAVVASRQSNYWLLMVALVLYGVANTSNQQSRFAAADVTVAEARARTVGLVVWASTIGVVIGPKLAAPAGKRFESLGHNQWGGAFVVAAMAFAIAAVALTILLRPDPLDVARSMNPTRTAEQEAEPVDVRACLRRPSVKLPVVTLMVNQIVMVSIMSVTNVHLRDNGYTTGAIGTVISGHVFGMFAPSPISGWLSDKIGRIPMIIGSSFVMVTGALLAALANPTSHGAMIAALFVLGVGWNGNFVAGSALVTEAVTQHERTRLQGVTDMITYFASAVAAIGAGLLVGTTGYPKMALIGGTIAALLGVLVLAFRSSVVMPDRESALV
jgi:MFS family permease